MVNEQIVTLISAVVAVLEAAKLMQTRKNLRTAFTTNEAG